MAVPFCRLLFLVPTMHTDPNRLIPRPQQTRYGEGRFALKGVTISFESNTIGGNGSMKFTSRVHILSNRLDNPVTWRVVSRLPQTKTLYY